jgi:tetrapyrrole methylase family protein/MazG family protein
MTVTIVGLGPGNPGHLTRQAWQVLTEAREVFLRTALHPVVASLPSHLELHSFDHLYERLDEFTAVYHAIAEEVITRGRRSQGVVYAVPGHPLVGEASVQRILEGAREEGLSVRLVEGLSFVEPVLSLLGLDGLAGLQLADATELASAHHPLLDPDRPALLGQLYGRRLASDVKLTLMNAYPHDHPVTLVRAAGTSDGDTTTVPLHELDRGLPLDHLTTLYVPPLPHVGGLPAFQNTVARLRAPDGCPWDREQTHQSLRRALLEETYEVLSALDAGDSGALCEELGDLLMQIAMHAQIATDEGAFQFADLIARIDSKLKRRHPHVFGDLEVRGTADVLRNWETIKAGERAEMPGGSELSSGLDSVPANMPALARAQALGERAARAGFDWPDVDSVLHKVCEEVSELKGAEDPGSQAGELGDLLFTLTNVARWLGLDAESALRETSDRFIRRYSRVEHGARARGGSLAALSPAELEALWEDAKSAS